MKFHLVWAESLTNAGKKLNQRKINIIKRLSYAFGRPAQRAFICPFSHIFISFSHFLENGPLRMCVFAKAFVVFWDFCLGKSSQRQRAVAFIWLKAHLDRQ